MTNRTKVSKAVLNKLLYFASHIATNTTRATSTEKLMINMAVGYISNFYTTNLSLDDLNYHLSSLIFKARNIRVKLDW